ncbi:hypothetical protein S1361_36750 [Streptomyces cyanogenus]|uniref:Uncharacterized protein n=1 Tax=Streptomyces cyanogenus TaxID=80860 RepID=A0ABX7U293_STRCY|nr:hypothetical protein S1361_36750 [Streptomyces cyanogenus]
MADRNLLLRRFTAPTARFPIFGCSGAPVAGGQSGGGYRFGQYGYIAHVCGSCGRCDE